MITITHCQIRQPGYLQGKRLTLKLPGPATGVSGSLTVTIVENPYGRGWGK